MWNRTKRLINSYLDGLIEKHSNPGNEVRNITRAEIVRLNEVEAQALGAAKFHEKELAELELKILGLAEKERIFRERGDATAAANAVSAIQTLSTQRDLLKQQIAEAKAQAARARALRDERRVQGEELATETHLTAMKENIASAQSPFDPTDPAATIDEMRQRLGRAHVPSTEARIAEADREMEAERARAQADEILARYKQSISGGEAPPQKAAPAPPVPEEKEPEQPKTLGRTDGPVRPID
ncbi:MAG TPA: hypothetical protein VNO70_12720 [Blastocatellia bacterium]|nr:hypothetical protein [Blastocatellia bacterium]